MAVNAFETSEQLSRARGCGCEDLGPLYPSLQNQLFEEAVTSQDEKLRSRLAIFLHAKHPRTCAAVKVRAMLEPDSLGG